MSVKGEGKRNGEISIFSKKEPGGFPEENSGTQKTERSLHVLTRSGDGEATVSYPVQVFVFQGQKCVAVQTIGSVSDDVSIDLVEGTYNVCAVGGAASPASPPRRASTFIRGGKSW